jgi:VCBS repeat-containing protein
VTILASDTFNRANENPILTPWLTRHDAGGTAVFQLLGNAIKGDLTDIDICVYDWTGSAPSSPDYKTTLIGFVIDTTNPGGPVARRVANGTGDDDYYVATLTTVAAAIVKRLAAGNSTLVSNVVSYADATSHDVQLEVSGTGPVSLIMRVDGVTVATFSDSASPLTAVGFPGVRNFIFNGVDEFRVEDLGGAAQVPGDYDAFVPQAAPALGPNIVVY